jgi:hypothetical protein
MVSICGIVMIMVTTERTLRILSSPLTGVKFGGRLSGVQSGGRTVIVFPSLSEHLTIHHIR